VKPLALYSAKAHRHTHTHITDRVHIDKCNGQATQGKRDKEPALEFLWMILSHDMKFMSNRCILAIIMRSTKK
jgi:hypothetical protein